MKKPFHPTLAITGSTIIQMAAVTGWWRYSGTSILAPTILFIACIAMLISSYAITVEPYAAEIKFISMEGSPIRQFKGRLLATLKAISLTLGFAVAIIWEGFGLYEVQTYALISLSFIAGVTFTVFKVRLDQHISKPFSNRIAITLTTAFTSAIFIPLITWVQWNYAPTPSNAFHMPLSGFVLQQIRQADSAWPLINEVLSVMLGIDAIKLWVALRMGKLSMPSLIIFALTNAFVAIIFSKTAATCTAYLLSMFRTEKSRRSPAN